MPRYFFHFRCGPEYVDDREGEILIDIAAARVRGETILRHILADDVQSGVLEMSSVILIEDEGHEVAGRVAFSDVLTLKLEGRESNMHQCEATDRC